MARKISVMFLSAILIFILGGCQMIRIEEGEVSPVEYTVVSQEDVPAEALSLIQEKREKDLAAGTRRPAQHGVGQNRWLRGKRNLAWKGNCWNFTIAFGSQNRRFAPAAGTKTVRKTGPWELGWWGNASPPKAAVCCLWER